LNLNMFGGAATWL